MISVNSIHPINNNCLVHLEERNENRLIHIAGTRSISSARRGTCLRSERFVGKNVLVAHGGTPLNDDRSMVLVPEQNIISVNDILQDPYIRIQPEEARVAGLITLPETFFSGWYILLETYPGCELQVNQRVLPIYGEPRLEMEDDSEYCSISAIGVVEC